MYFWRRIAEMNPSQFSLGYLRPSIAPAAASESGGGDASHEAAAAPGSDPWDQAINFYGGPVLTTLQEQGRKTVRELFEITRTKKNAPRLILDEFVRVIDEMSRRRQVTVIERTGDRAEWMVALPISS